jgi:hypothetical protein
MERRLPQLMCKSSGRLRDVRFDIMFALKVLHIEILEPGHRRKRHQCIVQ